MRIVTIVGARPQFIKASVVSRAFKNYDGVKEIIIHTGQHYDSNMSDIFFQEMEIPKPDYLLNIQSIYHGAMTGMMLEKIEAILIHEKPDWVLVYGDTNSTLAGALAAAKLNIKIAHVESGLRSFNMQMPEEINRILTDRISSILFCPTKSSIQNLLNEGFNKFNSQIYLVGDIMYEAALFYSSKAKKPIFYIRDKFIICTIHRAENTDDYNKLREIISALEVISNDYQIILPIHPRTKNILLKNGYDFRKTNIDFVNPVSYLEMVYLLQNSNFVITDSGGLQKEAYFFKKYCLTLRDETEWIELVNNGFNLLCGSKKENILVNFNALLEKNSNEFNLNFYGDGKTSDKILEVLTSINN